MKLSHFCHLSSNKAGIQDQDFLIPLFTSRDVVLSLSQHLYERGRDEGRNEETLVL